MTSPLMTLLLLFVLPSITIQQQLFSSSFFTSTRFPFTIEAPLGNAALNVSIHWGVDWDSQLVRLGLLVKNTRTSNPGFVWMALGFSDHGQVEGSDVCMLDKDDRVIDGWISKEGFVSPDRKQDCTWPMILRNWQHTSTLFTFLRPFATCDWKDYAIEDGTTQFLVIVGTGHDYLRNVHGPFISKAIIPGRIFRSPSIAASRFGNTQQFQADEKTLDIDAINARVPAEITTYWCAIVRLPEHVQRRKHHITKIEAMITKGNEHLVHHMEVFHCVAQSTQATPVPSYNGPCNSSKKPRQAKICSNVMAAWTFGAGPIDYPPETGTPFGGVEFYPFVMIEIHYNNPARLSGIVDNSGIRFHYTDRLRRFDSAILELGLIYSDAMSIPYGQRHFSMTAYCIADCTTKFPPGGITIFATQLHAHLTGRKLWTSHYRDGVKLGEINRDNHYSAHWQEIHTLIEPVVVLPGDVLTTTCIYDTRELDSMTLGGYGIEDEMCVNYLHYYPKSAVEVCKSSLDNSTLRAYFHRIGERDDSKSTADKYKAVHWTDSKVADLQDLYAQSPLIVDCLQHKGLRFPDHPTNWTNVIKPWIRYTPVVQVRDPIECPSLND